MPIYEYECRECGKEFEEIVMGREEGITCPDCHSVNCKKLMSLTKLDNLDQTLTKRPAGDNFRKRAGAKTEEIF